MSLDEVVNRFIVLYKTMLGREITREGDYLYEKGAAIAYVPNLSHLCNDPAEILRYVQKQSDIAKYMHYYTNKDLFLKSVVSALTELSNNTTISRPYYDYFNETLKISLPDIYLSVTKENLDALNLTQDEVFDIGLKNATQSDMAMSTSDNRDRVVVTLDNQCAASLILAHDLYNYWSQIVGENYLCLVPSRNLFICLRDDEILYTDESKSKLSKGFSDNFGGTYPVSKRVFRCVRDGFFPEDALQIVD